MVELSSGSKHEVSEVGSNPTNPNPIIGARGDEMTLHTDILQKGLSFISPMSGIWDNTMK